MTIQCCMCKKVRIGDAWQPLNELSSVPSSTYCPTCFDRYSHQLAAEREAYRRDGGLLTQRAV